MAKINKEEYEALKGIGEKWRWITREIGLGGFDELWLHEYKPKKQSDFWQEEGVEAKLFPYSRIFRFIKWEDTEPWSVQELIEEYEEYYKGSWEHGIEFSEELFGKSEETEMRKDIEWLNNEVEKRIKKIKTDEVSFLGSDYFDEGYIHGMRDVQYIAKQLDEPETLSQEWIDEKSFPIIHQAREKDVVPVKDLKDKLVKKQELPIIPQFVAEFLKGKEEYMLYELLDNDFIYDDYDELARWLYDNDEDTNKERELSLVLAHMYGYKLEKEQKYFAKIKGHENISSDDKYWSYCITDESLEIGDNKVHTDVLAEYVLNATKDEWKALGINEDNADFVEVEELEE